MNGILEWEVFSYKFRGNPQAAFETLAYHMFCRKYHITEGLPAFYNQKHIETDPYTCDDGTVVGFQAKYYSTPSITTAQKGELIKAIEGAATTYDGLNMLCFYLSRPFSQSSAKGETKTEMQKEIKSKADELGITIEWIVPSNFEKILNKPENADLREYFFCVEPSGETSRVLPKCLTTYLPLGPEIGLVGRDEIVDELRAMLDKEKCVALVRGLGGIGKTAVMQKVCDKILTDGNDRNHVAWITCGDSLEDDLLVLSDAFGIPKNIGKEESFNAVLRAMKEIEGRLYLFLDDLSRDSVIKDLKTLNSLRPNVHVMITSRRQIKGIPHLELHELNDGSAIDMFYGYYERDEKREYLADAIGIIDSESVKRHTLLVELLAKAANRSFDTLDVFLGELEKKGFFEVSKARLNTAHDENLSEDYTKALEYLEKALDIREQVLGSNHPDTATTYNNVAGALRAQGDSEDALRYFKKALEIREHVLGSDHPSTATTYNNIAGIFREMGNYSKALEYYKKVLEIGERVFGRDHPNAATIYNNMGLVYHEQKNYSKAQEYYKRALEIRERVLGNNHPLTAKTYKNIAELYLEQKDYTNALEYYKKSYASIKRVTGSHHLGTERLFNNKANMNRSMRNSMSVFDQMKTQYCTERGKITDQDIYDLLVRIDKGYDATEYEKNILKSVKKIKWEKIHLLNRIPKANNLNTYKYLEMLLTVIPNHMNDTNLDFIEALLPWSSVVQQECQSKSKKA